MCFADFEIGCELYLRELFAFADGFEETPECQWFVEEAFEEFDGGGFVRSTESDEPTVVRMRKARSWECASDAVRFLGELDGGPLTFSTLVLTCREAEEMSQAELGELVGVSRAYVCDIEKGRRRATPERAAQIARALGMSESQFVRYALQDVIDDAGLDMSVRVDAA